MGPGYAELLLGSRLYTHALPAGSTYGLVKRRLQVRVSRRGSPARPPALPPAANGMLLSSGSLTPGFGVEALGLPVLHQAWVLLLRAAAALQTQLESEGPQVSGTGGGRSGGTGGTRLARAGARA